MSDTSTTALLTRERLAAAGERLAPLPAAAHRLTTMLGEDDVDVRAVVDIVSYDPVLTAVLVSHANSAHAGFVRTASTVNESVVRLGLGTVAAIAMRTAVTESLQKSLPVYGLEGDAILLHAIRTSVTADALRAVCPARIPAATATVALLHDVGKILISDVLGMRALELVSRLGAAQGRSLIDVELEVFGVHHAQAGVHAIRRWNLPMSFVEAVGNHHGAAGETSFLAGAVHAADVLAHALDRDTTSDASAWATDDEVTATLDRIGVDRSAHERVLTDIESRFAWVQTMLASA